MKNGDQLAYPVTTVEHTGFSQTGEKIYSSHTEGGMTKRETFAMSAMQGLLSNSTFLQAIGHHNMDHTYLVKISMGVADELLKQLES